MAIARPLESHRKRLTDAEFLHLPDDGHQYELVDGALKEAPTTVEHDVIADISSPQHRPSKSSPPLLPSKPTARRRR